MLPKRGMERRWILASLLWVAVLAELEAARLAAPVRVYGPGGRTLVMSRGAAEMFASRNRLQRAPDEVMREQVGLPPRIAVDATSDHTRLAGIDQPEE